MNSNELRIGSKIEVNGLHGHKIMTVESIGEKGTMLDNRRVIFFKEDDCQVGEFLLHCSGVKLTEEWILKAGFVYFHRIGQRIFYHIGNLYIELWAKNGMCAVYYQSENVTCFIHYLHQLQNLYFALTGEELEVPS